MFKKIVICVLALSMLFVITASPIINNNTAYATGIDVITFASTLGIPVVIFLMILETMGVEVQAANTLGGLATLFNDWYDNQSDAVRLKFAAGAIIGINGIASFDVVMGSDVMESIVDWINVKFDAGTNEISIDSIPDYVGTDIPYYKTSKLENDGYEFIMTLVNGSAILESTYNYLDEKFLTIFEWNRGLETFYVMGEAVEVATWDSDWTIAIDAHLTTDGDDEFKVHWNDDYYFPNRGKISLQYWNDDSMEFEIIPSYYMNLSSGYPNFDHKQTIGLIEEYGASYFYSWLCTDQTLYTPDTFNHEVRGILTPIELYYAMGEDCVILDGEVIDFPFVGTVVGGALVDTATSIDDYATAIDDIAIDLETGEVVTDISGAVAGSTTSTTIINEYTTTYTGDAVLNPADIDKIAMNPTLRNKLISKFPFCIPFDLVAMLSSLSATPVMPEFEGDLDFYSGGAVAVSIPFELPFEEMGIANFALLTRIISVLAFSFFLMMVTKKMLLL